MTHKSKLTLVSILALALAFLSLPATAQSQESGGVGDGAWKLLRQPMDLPDLPKFTGQATFVKGLMYPNKPGGPAIDMHYRVRQMPDAVMQWYLDALKSYKWSMKKNGKSSGKTLRAKKGRNGVVVNVAPCKMKGYLSELRISYKLHR